MIILSFLSVTGYIGSCSITLPIKIKHRLFCLTAILKMFMDNAFPPNSTDLFTVPTYFSTIRSPHSTYLSNRPPNNQ